VERDPLWVGETRTIAFASNRGGQLDIWTVDAKSGRSVQLTTSETAETPTDATSDGSIVTYEQRTERASLWLLPAGSHAARQLSNEALSDLFPSSSAGGDWIAFQRRSAVLVEANDFFDARVLVAALSGRERLTAARVAADGFAPRMAISNSFPVMYGVDDRYFCTNDGTLSPLVTV
jgi:Tol biopolymer transport system component